MYFIKFFFFFHHHQIDPSLLCAFLPRLFFSRLLSKKISKRVLLFQPGDREKRSLKFSAFQGQAWFTPRVRDQPRRVFRARRIARVPVSRFSGVSKKKKKGKKKRKMSALHSPYIQSVFTDFETKNRSSFCSRKKLFDSSFGGPEVRQVAERRCRNRRLTVHRSSKDFLFPLMVEIDGGMVEGKKVRGRAKN